MPTFVSGGYAGTAVAPGWTDPQNATGEFDGSSATCVRGGNTSGIFSVGLCEETESCLALTKTKGVFSQGAQGFPVAGGTGLCTETNECFALALTETAIIHLGIAMESDTALTLTSAKVLPVGVCQETDTCFRPSSVFPLNPERVCTESDTCLALTCTIVTEEEGWTEFDDPATYGGKTVYVAANGSDANNGLSEGSPKLTPAAGYALITDGVGDHLLLRRGDTIDVLASWSLTKNGNPGASRYMRIGAYGNESLPRPVLRFNGSAGFIGSQTGTAVRGMIAITDIDIACVNPPHSTSAFFFQNYTNLLIEGCKIVDGPWPGGIVVQAFGGGGSGTEPTAFRITGLKIRRNVIADCTNPGGVPPNFRSTGGYIDNCDGWLIEENIADNNGSHPDPTTNTGRNWYVHEHCTGGIYRYNIGARGCDADIQMRPGGELHGNLMLLNPYGATIGSKGGDIELSVIGNVVLYGDNISAVHPRGTGLLVHHGDNGATVTHNVVCYNTLGTGDSNAGGIELQCGGEVAYNCIYDWPRPGSTNGYCLTLSGTPGSIIIHHNTMVQLDEQMIIDVRAPWQLSDIQAYSNSYNYDASAFWDPFRPHSQTEWVNGVVGAESGSTFNGVPIPDPHVRIGELMAVVLGGTWSSDPATAVGQFMAIARQQRKGNWSESIMPKLLNPVARARAGVPEP